MSSIWTLTVDDNDSVTTTVHATEAEAKEALRVNHLPDFPPPEVIAQWRAAVEAESVSWGESGDIDNAFDLLNPESLRDLPENATLIDKIEELEDADMAVTATYNGSEAHIDEHPLPDPRAADLVERMAGWVLDGERTGKRGKHYEMSIDEAYDTIRAWVTEAREITGKETDRG